MRGKRAEVKPGAGALEKAPPVPATLPRGARAEWQRVVSDLSSRGLLYASALGAIETYCVASWTRSLCAKAIEKDGAFVKTKRGEPKPHPALGIMNKQNEQIARLAAELGLTPAARSRKALQGKRNDEKEDSSWAEMDI